MSTKTKTIEKNSTKISTSAWSRAFTSNSEWPDKVSNSCNNLSDN